MSSSGGRSMRSSTRFDGNSPSMVQRNGDSFVVRSVVSGTSLNIPGFEEPPVDNDGSSGEEEEEDVNDTTNGGEEIDDENLPQCKIKRNYSCTKCNNFFTQNPRTYLYHLRDAHKEKIKIYECPKCVYASKHSQKLQRHVDMVHNSKKIRHVKKIKEPVNNTPPTIHSVEIIPQASTSKQVPVQQQPQQPIVTIEPEVQLAEDESDDEFMLDGTGGEIDDESGVNQDDDSLIIDSNASPTTTENESSTNEEIKCSMCNFICYSRSQIQRHENEMHFKKKFFRCTKCNYVTHMKARFTKHVKYHSMPMIKCDLCDFRTPYKWNLDRHYKNHQGDGEFKCPLCNFNADIKQSLTVHVQNHHLTPQQRLLRGMNRRNKVGASDAPAKELRMADVGLVGASLPSTSQSTDYSQHPEELSGDDEDIMEHDDIPELTLRQSSMKGNQKSSSQATGRSSHYGSDFVHPDDILHKNGKVYYKNLKCNYCSYKAFWEGDISRHEFRAHGIERKTPPKNSGKKTVARPIPNLIPLQQSTSPTPPPPLHAGGTSILRIPSSVGSRRSSTSSVEAPPQMSEQDINDICANSALKDFASLFQGAFQGESTDEKRDNKDKEKEDNSKKIAVEEKVDSKPASPSTLSTGSKRKNTSFFDKLKEKLIGQEVSNLVCDHCGHESKCLSEAVCHQKLHKDAPPNTQRMASMVGVSSTRCQHCRHRCKTSADLLVHLQSCLNKDSGAEDSESKAENEQEEEEEEEEPPQCPNCGHSFDTEEDLNKHLDYCKARLAINPEVSITEIKPLETHPMENKVFVWNQFNTEPPTEQIKPALTIERLPPIPKKPKLSRMPEDMDDMEDAMGNSFPLMGYELAPGYGAVCTPSEMMLKSNDSMYHLQKVYKCDYPKCNFWASAASRFHIHIVGHLNHKPFGCSQCDYRSNWRWDVAKHIRLKGVRDPLHSPASRPKVLVHDDDSSRRNYSKYNKYLTLMSVKMGQSQSDSPPPLSGPPKLIPAPHLTPEALAQRKFGARPPPPLRTAPIASNSEGQSYGIKRPSEQPPPTKKLLWRCKKCNYRGVDKAEVLEHVRTHYQTPPIPPAVNVQIIPKPVSNDHLKCDKCPFIAKWQGDLHTHQQNHIQLPTSIFKCFICPYYVATKNELLAHMKVHGVNDSEDLTKAMHAKLAAASKQSTDDEAEEDSRRYKCGSCPYETEAHHQFLLHLQQHGDFTSLVDDSVTITRASNPSTSTPLSAYLQNEMHKCHICHYTVEKKSILHQHLMKMHGVSPPIDPSKRPNVNPQLATFDFQSLKDVPWVWVWKNGKFLKMFKCRFCPHVNLRKINIQEHEKMHTIRKPANPSEPNLQVHRCPQCNYQCNNAGVLSAHAKVHMDSYPLCCALVDPHRSDAEQIQELGGDLNDDNTEMDDNDTSTFESGNQSIVDISVTNSPYNEFTSNLRADEMEGDETRIIYFCRECPARFVQSRELVIHKRFHRIRLQFQCAACSYSARESNHLETHEKVHTQEYYDRTKMLLEQHPMSSEHSQPILVQRDGLWIALEEPMEMPPLHKIPRMSSPDSLDTQRKTARMTITPPRNFASPQPESVDFLRSPRHFMSPPSDYVPLSGTELFKQKQAQNDSNSSSSMVYQQQKLLQHQMFQKQQELAEVHKHKAADPVFGTMVHGDPKFVYPTYMKNGKMKEKRYKCPKCPSAFEKRDQYKVHLGLHGSKQKYRCERCDYSVKYFANYIQHVKKHNYNDEMQKQGGGGGVSVLVEDESAKTNLEEPDRMNGEEPVRMNVDEPERTNIDEPLSSENTSSSSVHLSASGSARRNIITSCAESEQIANLLRLRDEKIKKLEEAEEEIEKRRKTEAAIAAQLIPTHWCKYCPYYTNRKDSIDTHTKRHLVYDSTVYKGNYMCNFCDFTASQPHFLREHIKIHFILPNLPNKQILYGRDPEKYVKVAKLEIWAQPVNKETGKTMGTKRLVFKDRGNEDKELTVRFLPKSFSKEIEDYEEDYRKNKKDRFRVNGKTGDMKNAPPIKLNHKKPKPVINNPKDILNLGQHEHSEDEDDVLEIAPTPPDNIANANDDEAPVDDVTSVADDNNETAVDDDLNEDVGENDNIETGVDEDHNMETGVNEDDNNADDDDKEEEKEGSVVDQENVFDNEETAADDDAAIKNEETPVDDDNTIENNDEDDNDDQEEQEEEENVTDNEEVEDEEDEPNMVVDDEEEEVPEGEELEEEDEEEEEEAMET